MTRQDVNRKAFFAILAFIFLIALLAITILISINVNSEVSVKTENNHNTVPGCYSRTVYYYLDLNNSDDDDVEGDIIVDNAKSYENKDFKSKSSIVATFGGKSNINNFTIPGKDTKRITLTVEVEDYAPAGIYYFQLTLKIDDNEIELEKDLVLLTVESHFEFDMDLDEKSAEAHEGETVEFKIIITNKGNIEERIDFVIINFPSEAWKEKISFNENPIIVPMRKLDENNYNIKITYLTVVFLNLSLEINEISKVYFEFSAISQNGALINQTIRLKIKGPLPEPKTDDFSFWNYIERLPFPREFIFIFPIIAMTGGGIYLFAKRKREYEDVPSWEEWEENGIENGLDIVNKSTVNCPSCDAEMKITSNDRPLSIKCFNCDSKIELKSEGEIQSISEDNLETETVKNIDKKKEMPVKKEVKKKKKLEEIKETTIKCPKCDTKLKILTEKRPLTIHCPKCKIKIVIKKNGKTKAKKTEKRKSIKIIKCPKCDTKLKIINDKRPLTIRCPRCNIKLFLKDKQNKRDNPSTIKCPICNSNLKIKVSKRPLTINCPKCKTKIVIKGKKKTQAPTQKIQKNSKIIKCPKCYAVLKIKDEKRPLIIYCPRCKTKLNIK